MFNLKKKTFSLGLKRFLKYSLTGYSPNTIAFSKCILILAYALKTFSEYPLIALTGRHFKFSTALIPDYVLGREHACRPALPH